MGKNKRGKVVSKKRHALGKKIYAGVKRWTECVVNARKALGMKGFVAINGRGRRARRSTPRPRLCTPRRNEGPRGHSRSAGCVVAHGPAVDECFYVRRMYTTCGRT